MARTTPIRPRLELPLFTGNGSATNFYVVRHSDYQQDTFTSHTLHLPTSKGTLTIPQLGGSLTLRGRDSKWHVTDYYVGNDALLYSTAEVFTRKQFEDKTIWVVYGGLGELHELAVLSSSSAQTVEGSGVNTKTTDGTTIINWQTSAIRRVVQVGGLFIYILDRNTAYNYWVPDFAWNNTGLFTRPVEETTSVTVQAGYLVRNVSVKGTALHIYGDLNSTVPIKVIGVPKSTKDLHFNSQKVSSRPIR
jgi:Beta-galactosidase, domain 2/Beta-galactosidase, domain 3